MRGKTERSLEELYQDDRERADAVAFGRRPSLDRRGFLGAATVLADDVAVRLPLLGHFSATSDVLAYLTREALRLDMRLLVVDRRGIEQARVGDLGFYSNMRLSPDGTRAAVALEDPRLGTRDIWIFDLTGKPPLRLTFDPADDAGPGAFDTTQRAGTDDPQGAPEGRSTSRHAC